MKILKVKSSASGEMCGGTEAPTRSGRPLPLAHGLHTGATAVYLGVELLPRPARRAEAQEADSRGHKGEAK